MVWWSLLLLKLRTNLRPILIGLAVIILMTVLGFFIKSYIDLKIENERYKEIVRRYNTENKKYDKELKLCYEKIKLLTEKINKMNFDILKREKEILNEKTIFNKTRGKVVLR